MGSKKLYLGQKKSLVVFAVLSIGMLHCSSQDPAFVEKEVVPINTGAPEIDKDANASAKIGAINQDPADASPTPLPPSPTENAAGPDPFTCKGNAVALKAGQSAQLAWSWSMQEIASFAILQTTTPVLSSLGSLDRSHLSSGVLIYKAPASVSVNSDINVVATPVNPEEATAACTVRLIADSEIGVIDDGTTQGVKGSVFKLPSTLTKLPDFSTMTSIGQIVASNFDVPSRAWSTGFPGVRDLYEWFGIQFVGNIYVASDSSCAFRLDADDGANFYIDGTKVIDNDGVHPVRTVTGSATLAAGKHSIRMDYFQGPRYYIALQLYWKCNGQVNYQIVPPEAFRQPLQ